MKYGEQIKIGDSVAWIIGVAKEAILVMYADGTREIVKI